MLLILAGFPLQQTPESGTTFPRIRQGLAGLPRANGLHAGVETARRRVFAREAWYSGDSPVA